ncbi:hypothetical protein DL1_03455 [Thioclava dalianensis]|uniref:Hedgehog/Intein (Hint) domain-containing protein n=1 Tax=Thioclava dalianensis TaxID=1185766 RepID=A0A074TCM7_9RHOB|nr:Hint domain-containing protein [Thioclava dalianensis]KEP69541.1 hypothetical protein DL1_03455 [Thioclava dalianensis]SFN69203.1 Hint domain-containing protein [Thioclava dalianensis]
MEYGYPEGSVFHDRRTNRWYLAPDFVQSGGLWSLAPAPGESGTYVCLYDAQGRSVARGKLSADLPLFLDGPDAVLRLDRIEIDGVLSLYIPSEPLVPGHAYALAPPDWEGSRPASPEQIATLPALGAGTLIATQSGEVPIDWLRPGDMIHTRDHGYQPLLWLGQHVMPRLSPPECRPIQLAPDQFGEAQPAQAMTLSPDCPILLAGYELELWFGEREMFAHAGDLTVPPKPATGPQVLYTLLFDAPEIVLAGQLWVGSVHADAAYLALLPDGIRHTIAAQVIESHRTAARGVLADWETALFTQDGIRSEASFAA